MNIYFWMFVYLNYHLPANIHCDSHKNNPEIIDSIFDNKRQDIYPDIEETIGKKLPQVQTTEVKLKL